MRRLWFAALVLGAGCASAPVVRPADRPALDAADANVRRGCYACLVSARDAYERVAAGRGRPLVLERLVETNLLMAMRRRELALDPADAVGRARALARELPAALDIDRYLADAAALPGASGGTSRADRRAFTAAHRDLYDHVADELAWLRTATSLPLARAYLTLALECLQSPQRPASSEDRVPAWLPADAPPLLRYRAAICGVIDADVLAQVRTEVPEMAEAAYFLGAVEVEAIPNGGGANARALVFEAFARFGDSPAALYLLSLYYQTVGACADALRRNDELLALVPEHEDAWLGRTICFTQLQRDGEAIEAASHMIAREFDNRALAFYWRAVNDRHAGDLDRARADAEAARRFGATMEVLTLAGMIEYDQDDLTPADRDLRRALSASSGNCTAAWYIGLVAVKRQDGDDAARYFEAAMHCFDNAGVMLAGRRDRLARNQDTDPEYRRWALAAFDRDLETARTQAAASAVNAASAYLFLGQYAMAAHLLDVASADPGLSDDVLRMRRELEARRAAARAGP
jgi:hypothetical protein